MSNKMILCVGCKKHLNEKLFVRKCVHTGLIENGYIYCNNCIKGKNRLLDKFSRGGV